jgi:hypothetical protein
MSTDNDLAVRIAKLEAEGDIRRLKTAYAELCDSGYPGRELGALFTEDAVWDGGEHFGVHTGRAAIEIYFDAVSADVIWALHYMIGASITVSDDLQTATGTWYLWAPCTQMVEGEKVAAWMTGKYYDEYRLVDGVWQFSKVNVVFETISDVKASWIDNPFIR